MPIIRHPYKSDGSLGEAIVEHSGFVLSLYESNGYHDSDFYAVVWNPETQEPENVEYATTRFPCCNNAIIDATPDVVKAANEWRLRRYKERDAEIKAAFDAIPQIDSSVMVSVSKGKNKALDGKIGKVFWIGSGFGYKSTKRAGVEIDGERYFFSADNLYLVDANGVKNENSWSDAEMSYSIKRKFPATSLPF